MKIVVIHETQQNLYKTFITITITIFIMQQNKADYDCQKKIKASTLLPFIHDCLLPPHLESEYRVVLNSCYSEKKLSLTLLLGCSSLALQFRASKFCLWIDGPEKELCKDKNLLPKYMQSLILIISLAESRITEKTRLLL